MQKVLAMDYLLVVFNFLFLRRLLLADFCLRLGNVLSLYEHLSFVRTQIIFLMLQYLVFELFSLSLLIMLLFQFLIYDGLISFFGAKSDTAAHGRSSLFFRMQSLLLILLHLLLKHIFDESLVLSILQIP